MAHARAPNSYALHLQCTLYCSAIHSPMNLAALHRNALHYTSPQCPALKRAHMLGEKQWRPNFPCGPHVRSREENIGGGDSQGQGMLRIT